MVNVMKMRGALQLVRCSHRAAIPLTTRPSAPDKTRSGGYAPPLIGGAGQRHAGIAGRVPKLTKPLFCCHNLSCCRLCEVDGWQVKSLP